MRFRPTSGRSGAVTDVQTLRGGDLEGTEEWVTAEERGRIARIQALRASYLAGTLTYCPNKVASKLLEQLLTRAD